MFILIFCIANLSRNILCSILFFLFDWISDKPDIKRAEKPFLASDLLLLALIKS